MAVKQISVFLENKKGRLADVTKAIADNGINIKALALADTSDFGLLRLIVDRPDDCRKILKDNNFVVQETDVLAVEIEDRPGGLQRVLTVLDSRDVNIEYMYATIEKKADRAAVIFKTADLGRTEKTLAENGVKVCGDDFLQKI